MVILWQISFWGGGWGGVRGSEPLSVLERSSQTPRPQKSIPARKLFDNHEGVVLAWTENYLSEGIELMV